MFKSAALKLTLGYLAIIMALSIGCSAVIYRLSSNELAANARRPVDLYNVIFGVNNPNITYLREAQLDRDRDHLKANLIFFNLGILLVGGALSYYLARRTLQPIEDALEMQQRFTGDASHELRTPLTAMQTEIEVALRDKKLSREEAVALLNSNLEEVGKLKNLSEGLLTLATTAGKEVPKEQFQFKALANEAIGGVTKLARHRKIKLVDQAIDIKLVGNRPQILNLLSILLDNAIKYSASGQRVVLKSVRRDRRAEISVIDQGRGIAEGDLPHIFERFYRADSSRTGGETHGHGLGLAIAKKIVDLHNGSIKVKSKVGHGTTFTVRLPLA